MDRDRRPRSKFDFWEWSEATYHFAPEIIGALAGFSIGATLGYKFFGPLGAILCAPPALILGIIVGFLFRFTSVF